MIVTRKVSDVLTLMRRIIGRDSNDNQATDTLMLNYLNDFVTLKMPMSMHLANQFSTLTFNIDETTEGVYTFNDVGATTDFMDVGTEGFIFDPNATTSSWSTIGIYRDAESFYNRWGVNNEDTLTKGMSTEVLFYDNQFVFRTIPDKTYTVKMYGYKMPAEYEGTTSELQFSAWLRTLAYGSSLDYANDFNYSDEKIAKIEKNYNSERKHLLTQTHSELTKKRCIPKV
jgi:hypothetical protein